MRRKGGLIGSSYARRGKAPYIYSAAYARWATATNEDERIAADRAFRRTFNVPLCWKGGRAVYA